MTRDELMKEDATHFRTERLKLSRVHYPPRWVTIAISSPCTNTCLFCSYHSVDARNGKSNVYNLKYKMSLDVFKKHVDFFWEGRVPHVHICATGEPFLHDNIMDMIDYVIEKYGKSSFQSNFHPLIMEKGNYIPKILERRDNISYVVTDILSGDEQVFAKIKKGTSLNGVLDVLRVLTHNGIQINASCILTRSNYKELPSIIDELDKYKIQLNLNIVGLFPHMFNDFTSMNNVYRMADSEISDVLNLVKEKAQNSGIKLTLPDPFDKPGQKCSVFWDKIQIWPVKGIDTSRYDDNLVPHACNAVVLGDINSLGYRSDFSSVMDLWNNPKIVSLRENILSGIYPDKYCCTCSSGIELSPPEEWLKECMELKQKSNKTDVH